MENETNQRIFNVQKILYDSEKTKGSPRRFKKAKTLLDEARHNYSLVLLGQGTHNIEYAIKLLNVANNKAEQAMAAVDKGYKPKEFRTNITCTSLCHVGMEKRTVPFNDIKFSHETHALGNGMKCSDCHSPRENHGKTFLKNCATCHHGKEIKKVSCGDCHVYVKRLIEGKGGSESKRSPARNWVRSNASTAIRAVASKKKDTFDTIKKRCIECHDPSYGEMAVRWKAAMRNC